MTVQRGISEITCCTAEGSPVKSNSYSSPPLRAIWRASLGKSWARPEWTGTRAAWTWAPTPLALHSLERSVTRPSDTSMAHRMPERTSRWPSSSRGSGCWCARTNACAGLLWSGLPDWSRRRPPAGPPRGPVTAMASPGRALLRTMGSPGHSPVSARLTKLVGQLTTSPPTSSSR
uniref:Uncharacterized protein n=1 Tax=uncultured marine microorganism HF4000_APKG7H23 TaxID=455551 RepID=B3T9U2_9ZZZZ|nr:hypothetical protein ALOHA_HF4000APKG7H23ctg3g16 [uncultured marine microorganism HF4000_APKG7H23]